MQLDDTRLKHNPAGSPFGEYIIQSGPHKHLMDGTQTVYRFPNGYGASVITGQFTYTDTERPFEVGVLRFDNPKSKRWEITYDTPLTDDTLGYQTLQGVYEILQQIKDLSDDAGSEG